MNLLEETLRTLKNHNKTVKDVLWVGDAWVSVSWRSFRASADKEYDNGYGGAEINQGLVVVGDNWWLERGEYDGSEWWVFKEKPIRSENKNNLCLNNR